MSDDDSDVLKPRFDLAEGKGTPLGELPCFTTVKTRGAGAKSLETALEPLHRLVYGRPGVGGTRRAALEPFKGFPPAMAEEVKTKLRGLVKAKLRDLVLTLGMGIPVSQAIESLADGAADFLMAPKDAGRIKPPKSRPPKKREPSPSPAPAPPPSKRAKVESAPATTAKPPAKKAAAGPTDAEIQVQIYQRVLRMAPDARESLGVKALRRELEQHFAVAEGDLKDKKDLIAATASDCVRALLEAERRALLVIDSQTAALGQTHTATAASVASPVTPPEPTPSSVPPQEAVNDIVAPCRPPLMTPQPPVFEHQPL